MEFFRRSTKLPKNKRRRPHRSDIGLNRISWNESKAAVRHERVTQTIKSCFYTKILDAEKGFTSGL